MAVFEARPTEYKGTVYRSKCEAMFARWLELTCLNEGDPSGLIYEPESLRTSDGWVPDFLVWSVANIECGHPQLCKTVYEYKPSKPTKTYMDDFRRRTAEIDNLFSRSSFTHFLFFGSVYNKDRGYCFGGEIVPGFDQITQCDWIDPYEDAIRNTRFDLAQDC